MSTLQRSLLTCLGGALVVGIFSYQSGLLKSHPSLARPISVTTTAAEKLSSIFEGIPANPKMALLQARLDGRRARSSCNEPTRLSRALSLFGIGSIVVHAQGQCEWSCGCAGGCGGQPVPENCMNVSCGFGQFAAGYDFCGTGNDCGDTAVGSCSQCSGACDTEECQPCQC